MASDEKSRGVEPEKNENELVPQEQVEKDVTVGGEVVEAQVVDGVEKREDRKSVV